MFAGHKLQALAVGLMLKVPGEHDEHKLVLAG